MNKQSLALIMNCSGLSLEDWQILSKSLDEACEVFRARYAIEIKLVYALKHSCDLNRKITEKYGEAFELHCLTTAVKANTSVILNRLLKHCFNEINASFALILQSDGLLHRNSLLQAFEQHRRCPEALIGSKLSGRASHSDQEKNAERSSDDKDIADYNLLIPAEIYRKLGGYDCTLAYSRAAAELMRKCRQAEFRIIKLDPRAGLGSVTTKTTLKINAPEAEPPGTKSSLVEADTVQELLLNSEKRDIYQDFIGEFQLTRTELQNLQQTLRSLRPGFLWVSGTLAKIPQKAIRRMLGNPYRIQAVHSLLAVLGTFFAWLYFRVRLPGLFAYITNDNPLLMPGKSYDDYEQDLKSIADSGLFDTYYYLSQAPEAANHPLGPVGHYLSCGWHLSPHRLFDPVHYFSANELPPEAATIAPLLHYLGTTGAECFSPHPLFDAVYYVHGRSDLSDAAATFNPLQHYVLRSSRERRDPHPLFLTDYYLHRYHQQIGPKQTPLEHFMLWGHSGNFSPNPLFDCAYYLQEQPFLKGTLVNPLVHYVKHGYKNDAKTHALFDRDYYRKQLPDNEPVEGDLLAHFLHADAAKTLSPTPYFDADFYAERTPYVLHEGLNAFAHYLSFGEPAGLDPSPMFHTRWFRARHKELQDPFASPLTFYSQLIDNTIEPPHPFFDPEQYRLLHSDLGPMTALEHYTCFRFSKKPCLPIVNHLGRVPEDRLPSSLDTAFQKLMALTEAPFTHLILMPGMVRGGAERAACNYIKYIQDKHGKENVLILFSVYRTHTAMDWLPVGSRVVDLLQFTDETYEDAGLLQAAFIIEKKPPVVHCINSYNFKMAMARYRDVLEPLSKFVVYLFGYEAYTKKPNDLSNSLLQGSAGWVDCVITDSQKLVSLVLEKMPERRSRNTRRRTICCYNSALNLDELAESPAFQPGKKVLWASRMVDSKRPDILVALARRLPEIQFIAYGSTETGESEKSEKLLHELNNTPNISYRGEYSGFKGIDKNEIGVFLYTSDSDGIPMVLLEAAASQIPIIAPNIGGIPEFITPETGWLIAKFDDVEGYAKAILEALSHRELATGKAGKARALVFERHSLEAASARLAEFAEFF